MNKQTNMLLLISIIAISLAAILVKLSNAPSSVISMNRMFIAVILLVPFAYRYKKEIFKLNLKDFLYLVLAGLFLALHFGLWFGSLKLTTLASSTVILSLQPIIAVYDTNKSNPDNSLNHYYKLIYFCNRVSGELTTSVETSSVKYFGINNLPELSTKRNTTKQIKECFENRTNHTIIE